MIWSAYHNKNHQIGNCYPGYPSWKLTTYPDFNTILETLPKRQLSAINQYLSKHPLFPNQCIPSDSCAKDLDVKVRSSRFHGVYNSGGGYCVMQKNESDQRDGLYVYWYSSRVSLELYKSGT